MKDIIVAIDGYSGTGKSSTARAVAARLNYSYVDTGAMYRATTFSILEKRIDLKNTQALREHLATLRIHFQFNDEAGHSEVCLNEQPIEHEIRRDRISQAVSQVAALPDVRTVMVRLQMKMGESRALVMDGRDIGTVVFPDAELKIFMTTDPEVRARRRMRELEEKGELVHFKTVLDNLLERDRLDTSRADSPLRKAVDAIEIDTTLMTFEDQVDVIVKKAEEIINAD